MRILLVNPPRLNNIIPVTREDRCEVTDRYAVIPPYSLLWLAAILRNEGHEIEFIDANGTVMPYPELQSQIAHFSPDLLIFRFTPTTHAWDMKTAEIAKQISDRIVTLGLCFTLHTLIHEVLERSPSLDIYIPLNWETRVKQIIAGIQENRDLSEIPGIGIRNGNNILVTTEDNFIETTDFSSLSLPAYDLIKDFRSYRPNTPVSGNYMVIYTSKGCPFSCVYCTVAKTPFNLKPAEFVIKELDTLYSHYNVRLVSFFDETFTIDRKRTITICNAIKKSFPALHWYCNTRVNLVDPELLSIMQASGCRGIAYGVESGDQTILDTAKKGIKVEEAKRAILWTKEAGIKVYTSFILGLPGETQKSIENTLHFIHETLPHGAQFNIAVPYPGTELYNMAVKERLIAEQTDWRTLYQHKAILKYDNLSDKELEDARKNAYRSLYFNPRWILQNVLWIIQHPEDFRLGISYYWKNVKNYYWFGMEHAH
jgi:radical SAM superfamily enzyme YgiQ (UPF0313 family)